VEAVERKAHWLALAIGVVVVWSSVRTYAFEGVKTWELVVFLASLFCQVAAAALVVGAVSPARYLKLDLPRREQCVFFALALFALGLALLAVQSATFAYDYHVNSHSRVGG
jgi:DMSO reductase anchor subunit